MFDFETRNVDCHLKQRLRFRCPIQLLGLCPVNPFSNLPSYAPHIHSTPQANKAVTWQKCYKLCLCIYMHTLCLNKKNCGYVLHEFPSARWGDAPLGERVPLWFHCIIFPFVQVFPNTDPVCLSALQPSRCSPSLPPFLLLSIPPSFSLFL